MEFRWVALIALWTILSGPIFGGPSRSSSRLKARPHAAASDGTASQTNASQK
jgi:hypothetical protein